MIEVNPVLANTAATTQSVDKRIGADHGNRVVPATTLVGAESKSNNKRVEEAKVVSKSKESRETHRDEERLTTANKEQNNSRGGSIDIVV